MIDYSKIAEDLIRSIDFSLPQEQGGFVIYKDELKIWPATNISTDANKFVPRARDYVLASKRGQIVAIYHNHVSNGDFSPQDKLLASSQDIDVILVKPNQELSIYRPAIDQYNCVDFVKDYYKRLGITLQIQDLDIVNIKHIAKANNLIEIKGFEPDAILVISTNKGHHLGVCLNDTYYLHYNKTGEFRSFIPKQYVTHIYARPKTEISN